MNFSEITSQINSLNEQISKIQNMGNCFYNKETKEIIPVNEASGKDLSGFEYYDFLPENILNEINQFKNRFESLDKKTTKLKNEIENLSIQNFCEQNPEWSEDKFEKVDIYYIHQLLYNIDMGEHNNILITLLNPVLKIKEINSSNIWFSLLDENNNEISTIKYFYWGTTNKNLLNQILNNNSVGQIIKPEMVRVKMIQEEKTMYGRTLYKFDYLESVRLWMDKPGRK